MQYRSKVIIHDYVDKFWKYVKKTNPEDIPFIEDDIDVLCTVGIDKYKALGKISPILGHSIKMDELKISTEQLEYRLGGVIIDSTMHLVHGFVKKEQKTRLTDIKQIKKNLKDLKKKGEI
jgi:hypothetical protein